MDFPFCLQIYGGTLSHMMCNANFQMKRKYFFGGMTLLCFGLLAGCQEQATNAPLQQPTSPVVATVGDKNLYDIDIDYEILSMPESMRHIMKDASARAKVLAVMVKREAVAQKALEMGLNLDPLINYRMRQANNAVLIQSVREWQQHDAAKYSENKVAAYYKKHLNDFKIPEQIHARHILLSDKEKALEVLKLVKADPESFSTVAAQFSIDDSTKARGGDLNWFSREAMVPAFDKAVFALSDKNRLSKPVKTEFGWHVIEWLGKRDGSTVALEDAYDEIISILDKERLNDWINSLMNDADIEVVKPEYRLRQ